ncbi:CDP-glycerol poly(glycerophosphate) glycerophosphotransferase [Lapidilactobacillus concavus DSM 17758]|uniref:CDP-glycerol poly(Glycerophosphate) glycerophosphotransferase n=1 Tax=Lapidilactobacillus concavus DSM 17758 TaxID=1423735 RepID=A0A0R1VPL9_9LACO|nr:CDP-glycerol glycerophosphotransferase family protein [Lapidilactobacillus concavus]KRM07768.1 CDP-glycerol poly(glycerophosphate) glycerophosphotransferase [Lapidilactobacillus concavus DSM 17758]GEL13711.1 hypothetical protein LCO01nite_12600 [Lapidilactobacillus concavus]
MKAVIKKIVKYNPFIYAVYYYLCSFLLKILGYFVRTHSDTILFMSFGGRSFSDSPKEIYNYLESRGPNDLQMIWAFERPEEVESVDDSHKVKVDTLKFFLVALRAKVWVTNSSIERGLKFKKRNTIYFNTWHGTPLKKMGLDIKNNQSFSSRADFNRIDKFTVQSDYECDIFSRAFGIDSSKIFKVGLPRNDDLTHQVQRREDLRRKFGFTDSDQIILYTPTFREFEHNSLHQITSNSYMLMIELVKKLPANYKILSRSHYEVDVIKHGDEISDRIIDVSRYPDLNELMHVSDMLVSDYSSVIFDYSITEKPIFIFSFDFEDYQKMRGMYFNIEDNLLSSRTTDGLSQNILNSQESAIQHVKKFKKQYVNFFGTATKQSCQYILKAMQD